MEYFIRLTPDRQSKSGYCWNDNSINSSKWVTQVKFRISGQVDYFHLFFIQGDNLYGDGMTIFFTTKGYHDNVSFFLFLIIFRVICMVLMIISLVLLLIFLLLRILVYFLFPSFLSCSISVIIVMLVFTLVTIQQIVFIIQMNSILVVLLIIVIMRNVKISMYSID